MSAANPPRNQLKVKSLGIDTFRENIVFMRRDCHICLSEGFTALTRLVVHDHNRSIVATLNVVQSDILEVNEAALSEMAMKKLGVSEGDYITVSHLKPIESLRWVRAKMYHKKIAKEAFFEIIGDVTKGLYADIEIAAFIAGCAGDNLDLEEITWLTQAMIHSGAQVKWKKETVLDKHCVGGLPGNRTTPIVVSIVAAAGLTIPKTSSRAITSPAGTADAMETITTVDLSIRKIHEVVEKENGCLAWGGSVNLSPADDILIAVEKALSVDSSGQMIASVLSKKAAAGSTHVVIEIPVGETAKVRTNEEGLKLQYIFKAVGQAVGLKVEVLITDGTQPVGRGIGPALEAMDVLAVLRREPGAPQQLKERALTLAATLLEFSGSFARGEGYPAATQLLESGAAYEKFEAICRAQGGFREPKPGRFRRDILSETEGTVLAIDNRKLAKVAKLAGAPDYPSAGMLFLAPLGTKVKKGQVLFTLFAESEGELQYAVEYLQSVNHLIRIE